MNEKDENLIDTISNFLSQNIRGVQYGVYGLGLTGLFIAFRRVRPLQKFSRPNSVPKFFIERQVPLTGQIKGADFTKDNTLLQISHTPPVSLGRAGKPPYLPVQLAGIVPTQLGLSWLITTLNNKPITFTVLGKNSNYAVARILYQDKDVSLRLVELGFARVLPYEQQLEKNIITYKKFYKQLLRRERSAERHGNGMWFGSSPFYWKIIDKLTSKLRLLMLQQLPKRVSAIAIR